MPPTHEYIFDTPRLRARRIGSADVDALHAVYGDADAMRWVGDGVAITLQQCRQWVEVTQRNYAARGYGMFAVEQKPAGNVIGFCGLVHPSGQTEAELKYAYLRETWGQGIATEAAAALLHYGHAAHGINHVIATAAPANAASHRVLLKAGMRRGTLRANDDGSFTQLFAWTPA
jgi:ribosomal-protein-alanine N-acetyltransferase